MRIFFVCLLLTALVPVWSFGQATGVLKGRVVAINGGQPLGNAAIRLVNNASVGTVADADGYYSLSLDTGNHTLVCDYLGLAPDTFAVHISAGAVTENNIGLATSAEMLKTVVVSSGKFAQKLEELTVSMEVLKPTLINNRNTTSIETALEQVPGLTIIDNDPQIRGGSGFTFGVGSRVAIVVDGIPLLSGDAGRPEWSYIPVENISQVEIIKGSSSVLYGSSAINGVINVRTAYPTSEPKTTISYSAGEYSLPQSPAQNWYGNSTPGFMNLNFLHSEIVNNNLDVVIGGNANLDQGYIGPAPKMGNLPWDLRKGLLLTDSIPTFTNQDMLKERVRLDFGLRYRSRKVKGLSYGANGNGMVNKTNMPLAWLSDSAGLYRSYPGAVFLENQTFFNIDPFIRFDAGNSTTHSLVTRVFHTDDEITNNQSTSGTLYYGEYQLQKKLLQHLTVTGGLVGSLSATHAPLYDSSGTPNNRVTNVAGYVQADDKFFSVLNVSAGGRYEYFQTNGLAGVGKFIPRAGLSLRVMKGTWLRVSTGEGFRYPTITERYISTKAGLFGVFPNPSLQPETSHSYELGIKQGFKIGDCMGYVDVAGFRQDYHNTIEYLFGPWQQNISLFGFKFVNTGDSRVTGADITVACSTPTENKNFGVTVLAGYTYVNPISLTPNYVYAHTKGIPGSTADTNYSFKNTSMDTTTNVLKYRFKHMVKADVEVRIRKFGLGVSYRYYSKMENIDNAFQSIESLTQTLHTAFPQFQQISIINYWQSHKGFHIFDARVSYKISERQKISVVCNNVFNVAYFLRPLKIEAPRSTALQWVWGF